MVGASYGAALKPVRPWVIPLLRVGPVAYDSSQAALEPKAKYEKYVANYLST
jgi:hypothetical protein